MQAILPSRSLLLLIAIGVIDLIVTAVLHSRGLIVEINPLMRPLIDRSEWLFALVKGGTLVLSLLLITYFAKNNRIFVRRACLTGSAVYICVWLFVFFGAR